MIEKQLFPSHRYHPTQPSKIATNAAHAATFGPEWRDSEYPKAPVVVGAVVPATLPAPLSAASAAPAPVTLTCSSCASLKAGFERDWKSAQEEIATLKDQTSILKDELKAALQAVVVVPETEAPATEAPATEAPAPPPAVPFNPRAAGRAAASPKRQAGPTEPAPAAE